jgi:hypothetical protein
MKRLLGGLLMVLLLVYGGWRLWQHFQWPHTKQCVDNEAVLTTALNWYAIDNDGFPPLSPQKLVPIYIKALPRCDQPYDYEVVARNYTVSCHGGHPAFFMPPGYPKMATGRPPGKYLMLRP